MAASKRDDYGLRAGSEDTCRNCDKPIVFVELHPDIDWRHDRRWHHKEPHSPDAPALCPPAEDGLAFSQKRAEPMNLCQEGLSGEDNYGQPCNRPITNREFMRCGVHAKPYEERKAAEAEREMQREAVEHAEATMDEFIVYLKEFWEVEAHPEENYRRYGVENKSKYSGFVCVNPTWLKEMLEKMEESF